VKTIGIVGYGQMGAAMAPQLAKMVDRVIATDIDATRREAARTAGYLAEPREVASAPVVILALRGPDDVRTATLGRFGSGQLVIDTTSIDPATAIAAARDLAGRTAKYVEAPVLGGPPQVGRWVFLFGGDGESVETAASILAALGDGDHFGDFGSGSEAKLLNNILTGVHAAAVAEVLRVAIARGLDVGRLQRAIMRSESAGRNPVLEIRVPKILNGTLGDTFSIDNEAKDLGLALSVFRDAAPLYLTKTTYELFLQAQQKGWGARDIGRLAEALDTAAAVSH